MIYKTILITGVGGYIGSALMYRLKRNYRIIGVGRGTNFDILQPMCDEMFSLRKLDITKPQAFNSIIGSPNIVIHCSGPVLEQYCQEYPNDAYSAIVQGTQLVAEFCRQRKARMIHCSTFSVYSSYIPRALPLQEKDAVTPDTAYGRLKLEAEHAAEEASALILRLAHVYGYNKIIPYESRLVVDVFLQAVARGEALTVYGDGAEELDLIHINDVAHLISELLERSDVHGVLNVGSGRPITVKKLAELIIQENKLLNGTSVTIRSESTVHGRSKVSRWLSIEKLATIAPWFPGTLLTEGIREMLIYQNKILVP